MTTTENFSGSDATGSDGAKDRVITIANTKKTIDNGLEVHVNGVFLHVTTDFTITHNASSSTVKFLNPLWNDQLISVIYDTLDAGPGSPGGGILPLSQRVIQRELISTANTCTIIEISKSYGTDEYRAVTETETSNSDISCWSNSVNEEDEIVRQGNLRAGDMVFWFDSANESLCVQGNRITFDSKTFEMTDVKKFDVGGTTYLIEVTTKQQ